MNLGKTKVMVFHTSTTTTRKQTTLTLGGGQVEVLGSYVYLGITFKGTLRRFSMAKSTKDKVTRGYATFETLEHQCHQAHFQEPRTRGWLFDTLVATNVCNGNMEP